MSALRAADRAYTYLTKLRPLEEIANELLVEHAANNEDLMLLDDDDESQENDYGEIHAKSKSPKMSLILLMWIGVFHVIKSLSCRQLTSTQSDQQSTPPCHGRHESRGK